MLHPSVATFKTWEEYKPPPKIVKKVKTPKNKKKEPEIIPDGVTVFFGFGCPGK